MAFKMKGFSGFKDKDGDKVKVTEAELTKPRGYDPSKTGEEKYPEVKTVTEKSLKPGWTQKGNNYFFKGDLVSNPNMSDVFSRKPVKALHRGGEGVSSKDRERLGGAGSPKANYMKGYAKPGSKKRKKK